MNEEHHRPRSCCCESVTQPPGRSFRNLDLLRIQWTISGSGVAPPRVETIFTAGIMCSDTTAGTTRALTRPNGWASDKVVEVPEMKWIVDLDGFGQIPQNFFVLASESIEIFDLEARNRSRFSVVNRKTLGLCGAILVSFAELLILSVHLLKQNCKSNYCTQFRRIKPTLHSSGYIA